MEKNAKQMQGTEKQISFAQDIKAKFLAWVEQNIKDRFGGEIPQDALDKLEILKSKANAQTDAKWWIENCKLVNGEIFNPTGRNVIKLLAGK